MPQHDGQFGRRRARFNFVQLSVADAAGGNFDEDLVCCRSGNRDIRHFQWRRIILEAAERFEEKGLHELFQQHQFLRGSEISACKRAR